MNEYTVIMALEDYLPVIFATIGMYYIVQMIQRYDARSGQVAWVSLVLITIGGLSKATWKLIIAGTGTDIVWMNNMLFIFLGPGFTLMAWAVANAQKVMADKEIAKGIWYRPLVIILLFGTGAVAAYSQGGRTWVFILLGLTTFASWAVFIQLAKQANQQGLRWVAGFFIANIVLTLIVSGLARMEQTVAQQWIEQGIQTVSQLLFAIASWKLVQDILQETAVESGQLAVGD